MTAIPPQLDPQTDRPSKAILAVGRTESVLNAIGAKLVGVLMAIFFGHLLYLEVRSTAPSNARLALMAVPTFFGLAMLATDAFVATIKGVGGALSPFLPAKFGGKS